MSNYLRRLSPFKSSRTLLLWGTFWALAGVLP